MFKINVMFKQYVSIAECLSTNFYTRMDTEVLILYYIKPFMSWERDSHY